tara:strand:+ start:591 stop:1652 length:1062 start_codon:yes stop_codon:yes gene_type:complete
MAGAALKLASKVVPDLLGQAAKVTKHGWEYALKAGKLTQPQADNILRKGDIAAFDKFSVEGAQAAEQAQRNLNIGQFADKGQKAIPTRPSFAEWEAGGQKYYDEQWAAGKRHNVMEGYPHFTDVMQENPTSLKPDRPGVREYTMTTSSKISGDPEGKRKLYARDKLAKKGNISERAANEQRWVGELEEALKKRKFTEEERKNIITNMKRVNKQQETTRSARNKARKDTDPSMQSGDFLTIEHMGALKKGWANIPENREGLITRRANSAAGAHSDPNTWAINMTGMPGDPKNPGSWADIYAAKLELAKDFEFNPDFTAGLPIEIKKKILEAGKGGKRSRAKVDKILQEYFQDNY